ncbi:MAG: hypothetical protein APR54_06530 [Candidatus Cloacimonas sp. SDB]|nr:MAG: hypothetical protein APR54_06530 [Candidatus Cloacimonas sp. SDB]
MDEKLILLNLHYVGSAIAFLVKDIFTLRIIMIIAGLCKITEGYLSDNRTVIFWVGLFTLINIVQVIRIIYENRGVKLVKELEDIYKQVFYDMNRKEFQRFWLQGELKTVEENSLLCTDGDKADRIFLIINGNASVLKKNEKIADLDRGNFAAEMGYLTGKEISADVKSNSTMTYIFWTHKTLNYIKEIYPIIYNKFHLIISKDLTQKLKKYL